MRAIKKIIVHCSVSRFGDVELIRKWHLAAPHNYADIGYHYVITNGIIKPRAKYQEEFDGILQEGRPVNKQGAHCKGHNRDSIGICLIGDHHFSPIQFFALHALLARTCNTFSLKRDAVFRHADFDKNKSCPNFSTGVFNHFFKEVKNGL